MEKVWVIWTDYEEFELFSSFEKAEKFLLDLGFHKSDVGHKNHYRHEKCRDRVIEEQEVH